MFSLKGKISTKQKFLLNLWCNGIATFCDHSRRSRTFLFSRQDFYQKNNKSTSLLSIRSCDSGKIAIIGGDWQLLTGVEMQRFGTMARPSLRRQATVVTVSPLCLSAIDRGPDLFPGQSQPAISPAFTSSAHLIYYLRILSPNPVIAIPSLLLLLSTQLITRSRDKNN